MHILSISHSAYSNPEIMLLSTPKAEISRAMAQVLPVWLHCLSLEFGKSRERPGGLEEGALRKRCRQSINEAEVRNGYDDRKRLYNQFFLAR